MKRDITKSRVASQVSRSSFERLKLQEVLGEGANSCVYRGLLDGRPYAVKLYRGKGQLDEALLQFQREAAIHAGLHHAAIPRIFEVGLHRSTPYLISELIEGRTLAETLSRGGALPLAEVVRLGTTMASALDVVHAQGLVHRDIKPGNIIVVGPGDYRLIDFGLAGQDTEEVGDGAIGTFRYCAPEQLGLLELPIDGRADLYALGILMFECLTGVPPFPAESISELFHEQLTVVPPRLDTLELGCDPVFASIVEKLLHKEPDERYQTARALHEDLASLGAIREASRRGREIALGRRGGGAVRQRVFVGRAAELAHLRDQWRRASGGSGAATLIEGGAGSGKSGLVEAFIYKELTQGSVVLKGKCIEGDPFPLAPLRAVLRAHVRSWSDLTPEAAAAARRCFVGAAGELGELIMQLDAEVARALGVVAPAGPQTDARDLFYNALASFVLALGDATGGLVLWIDDVQWLDSASKEALELVASRLESHKLQLIFTARTEAEYAAATDGFKGSFVPWGLQQVTLSGLTDRDLSELVRQGLGENLDPAFVDQLVGRCHGNPLTLWQFFGALKESGVLRPYWGTWIVDAEALNSLELPSDIYELMTRRLNNLSDTSREVLTVAALLGHEIQHRQLARVHGGDYRLIQRALAEAQQAQLIEPVGGANAFSFVHDRVREALRGLLTLDVGELHRRAADVLAEVEAPSPRQIYELAHHTLEGYRSCDHSRVFEVLLVAAGLANTDHAYSKAWELCVQAEALGLEGHSDEVELQFHEAFGLACLQTDRIPDAITHFKEALSYTSVGVRRAVLRANIARATVFTFDTAEGAREIELAFAELGSSLPSAMHTDPASLQAFVMQLLQEGLEISSDPSRRGVAEGQQREIHKAVIDLCDTGFLIGYYERKPLFSMQCGVLALVPSHELGDDPDACRGFGTLCFLMGLLGKSELVRRFGDTGLQLARKLGDRQTLATTSSLVALGLHLGGSTAEALELQTEAFRAYGPWMGPIGFQNCCVDLLANHFARGQAREELAVAMASIERLETKSGELEGGYVCRSYAAAMSAAATLGLMDDAARYLAKTQSFVGRVPADRAVPWISVAAFKVNYYLQQMDFGAEFEAAVAEHQGWGIPPERSAHHSKHFYIVHAYARWEIWQQADAAARPAALEALRCAVEELRATSRTDTLMAHLHILSANLLFAEGALDQVEDLLDKGKRIATSNESPWAMYEEARTRARVYIERGQRSLGRMEAQRALSFAVEQGWTPRVRRLEQEFGVGVLTERRSMEGSATLTRTPAHHGSSFRLERQLEALLSLSRASASILDPEALARIALDESARVLGAERAYLFVVDKDLGKLVFQCGRTSGKEDLPEPLNYSRTIVNRVHQTGEAVVLSTGPNAEEISSESVMVYGLRSVLAAPLTAGDRVIGVVYVDNRLARGIFDQEHIDIFKALGHHITTAIETVRAARLEVRLQAETQRRRLADMLRELNTRLTSTLDMMDTLELLAGALASELPSDGLVATVFEEAGPRPVVVRGFGDGILPTAVEVHAQRMFDAKSSEAQVVPLEIVSGDEAQCLSLPLIARDRRLGALMVVRERGGVFTESDVDMGAALVGQASIAIDNARLFVQIRNLAERDELTSLFNRREFFRRSKGLVEVAATRGGPLTAIMFDVDHFKRFNDTYGHAIGDDVLRLVSKRAQEAVRESDVLCRYGGEEFAILLPGATGRIAALVAERVRAAIEGSPLDTKAHGPLSVTVSVGVSQFNEGDSIESLLSRADLGLYDSKAAGRNTVSLRLGPPTELESMA